MAITFYSGLPGKGKTALATLKAVKKFKSDNGKIAKFRVWISFLLIEKKHVSFRKIRKTFNVDPVRLGYSNYPILLRKEKWRLVQALNYILMKLGKKKFINVLPAVYCNVFSIKDCQMNFQFPKHSLLIDDEAQRDYDAREFEKFPAALGIFMQHHRHASIDDILLISQHPRRLDNKMRDLSEVFRKHRVFFTLPLIPFGVSMYTNYYEFEDYGKYHRVKKEAKTYDCDNHIRIFLKKNIFPRYHSKYYHVIFDDLKPIPNIQYTSLDMTADQINHVSTKPQKADIKINNISYDSF